MSKARKQHIRPLALAIIRRGDQVFVNESYDSVRDETFYRPLGGKIEFGERGCEAVIREFKEEVDAELMNVRYLMMFENIFTYEGRSGHEIVLMYEADFVDETMYEREQVAGVSGNDEPINASWQPLDKFAHGELILYPEGLIELLQKTTHSAGVNHE